MRRNNQTDASEGGTATRRGWGPFSGGQLTAIILGVVIAIAFPVGAFAVVSGSNSFVTDAVSGKRASVNANNQLSVVATPNAPSAMFAGGATVLAPANNASPEFVTASAAGKALVVTSITIASHGILSSSVPLDIYAGGGLYVGSITFTPGTPPTTIAYPSGLPLKNGDGIFIVNFGAAVSMDFVVNGYWIPAAQCVAPNHCY